MKIRQVSEFFKQYETMRVPLIGGIWYRFINNLDNYCINNEEISYDTLNNMKRDIYITASLTSFPARINYVFLAIKSIMLQSIKPDRIILWLAESQFPDKILPSQLNDLIKYGLEIKWCDDLYGHKKYFYCIKEQKENEVIITFDDDIIYPVNCIKRLINKYIQYPKCLICERAQSLKIYDNGEIEKNPGKWNTISNIGINQPSFSLNPSPGSGCLIPYKIFYKDAYDEHAIRNLAYKNDDLWYMFMAAQNGTKIIKTRKYHKIFSTINGSQITQMAFENVVNNVNIDVFNKLSSVYPEAYERIVNLTNSNI